jgi:hypothetical protein
MPAREQAQVLPLKLYIFHVHIRAMTIAEGIAIPLCQGGEIGSKSSAVIEIEAEFLLMRLNARGKLVVSVRMLVLIWPREW